MANIQISLIGCGGWGRNIARNLNELGVLHSIVDPSSVAAELASKMGVRHFGSTEQILADPSVPAVAIATPAATHFEVAMRALSAGKDVFIEKPIALDAVEGETLKAAADANQRVLMVGHLLQYHPAFLAVKKLVADGDLGQIRFIQSNRLSLGIVRSEENVLWSFAPHDISMILAIAGKLPARVSTSATAILQKDVADIASIQMEFDTGLKAAVNASWLSPDKEQKLIVLSDHAMVVFRDTVPWEEKVTVYPQAVRWIDNRPKATAEGARKVVIPVGEPLRDEMRHFIECVATRQRPRTDAAEAIAVLKVLQAAQMSMDRGGEWTNVCPPTVSGDTEADWKRRNVYVDKSAKIDAGVTLGDGCRVWHFSHVLAGSRLGESCVLGQNVMVGPDVTVGNGCKIQNNVAIYKGVTLEDDVFCGPSMVFTNVLTPRAHIERKSEFAPTRIGRGATLGANCTIVCGHNVGRYAMVGAGAVVTKDVPEHALVVGNPARQIGWVSRSGERLGADLTCPRTGEKYEIFDGQLRVRQTSD